MSNTNWWMAVFTWFLLSFFSPQGASAVIGKGPGGTSELQTIEERQQWSRLPSVVTWNEKPNAAFSLHHEEIGSEDGSSTTSLGTSGNIRMPGLGVFLLSAGAGKELADAKSCSSNSAWLQMLWHPRAGALLLPDVGSHSHTTDAGCRFSGAPN